MKLILESWRGYVEKQKLEELSGSDPVTYGQLKALLKLFAKAKSGLSGKALAQAAGLGEFFDSDEAGKLVDMFSELFEENENNGKILNEDAGLTLASIYGAYKLGKAAVPVAANLFKFGQKLAKKLKGLPTEETDKVPFLDLFNMDPKYAAIIDDRLEEKFLQDWLASITNKPDNEVVDVADLDINTQLQRFLRDEFQRTLSGHTSPGLVAQTRDDIAKVKKALKKKQVKDIAKSAVGL